MAPTREMSGETKERIIKLLKEGVSVLLLMAVINSDTSHPKSHFHEGLEVPEHCQDDVTVECAQELLNQIKNKTSQELQQESVENCLNIMMNSTSLVKENTTDQDLILYGNDVLNFTEELVSKLVRETDDIQSISISLQTLEVQVIELELDSSVSKIPSLTTTTASMDIEVTGIPNKSNVAVALMSFTNMAAILHASFFNTFVNTTKTIMSPVVSAKLLQVSGFTTTFSTDFFQISFTLKHVDELDPEGVLGCLYWNENEWVEDGCSTTKLNKTHTLCSCDHLGTFALIMQTYTQLMYNFWTICKTASVAVGILFLSLSILTLVICHPHKKVTNMTLINLCMSLLLAMLLRLLTKYFRAYICPRKHLFPILEGVLLFFFLSAFMWMFNKAVLFFIFVKNLSKVSSNQEEGLSCKWFILIGYLIPLVVMVVYGIVYRGIYTGFICSSNMSCRDRYIYFLPFYIISTLILILYIITIIIIISKLIRVKNHHLLRSNSNDTKLIMSVMFKSLAQFFIIGCPWLAYFFPTDVIGFFTVNLICIQQGAFIFLFHCLLNPEVRQQYRKFLCAVCCFNNRSPAAADGQEPQGTS
ncbi:putative adhesion G protein-coupled receptor E4P [Silurus meridionalis]|uniref:putative adhesion G protein-coupled receptor E4P n=1 Tax=Silurus meridionalis TaxID=175797 RepID=UPI001EEA7DF0|nr:putative adhesion G protein-coupled receptor E4P [Silurus meridionalis]